MHPYPTVLSMLVLLASTIASPHDENEASPTLKTTKITTTVVVTVTQTSDTTVQSPVLSTDSHYSDTTRYTSGYATPPRPDSVPPPPTGTEDPEDAVPSSTRTYAAPTLICLTPTEECIIDGIAIWPSGTTSISVPGWSFNPLPTSMSSRISSNSSILSSTAASSWNRTSPSTSTTCPHSMSHFVPGKPTSPPPSNLSISTTTLTTSQSVSQKNQMSILPIDLGTPQPALTNPTASKDAVNVQDVAVSATPHFYDNTGDPPATSTFRTEVLDPVGWAGVDDGRKYTKTRRGLERQENKATKRRKTFWPRFFVAAAAAA
ncbi:uncharacterized protein K460DRAFT_403725 [Cucurbitaria berberidis CBS 394.84]|uniref:Uncharacterized protein n=1 Tax=Cucurbitaria berberidis CBS 394.84 TaxID=1168544 RepID=A0A9P4GLC0_9PLEO|nr:uncharacterized protein K460DRAFT_403725 [Cucurbitaria berberidis CBS 394.84]KAF1848443.1 hypothetical protein K460DRAFT_403725 [Cucurbitaria berberidis CBS 394.84]